MLSTVLKRKRADDHAGCCFFLVQKGRLKQNILNSKVGLVSMDCRLWGGRPKGGLTDNRLLQLQQGLRSTSSLLLKVRKFFPNVSPTSLASTPVCSANCVENRFPIISYGNVWLNMLINRQGYCTQRPGQRGKQSGRTKNKTGTNKSRTDHNEGRQERVGQVHSTPEGRPHKKSQIRNPSANNRGQQSQRRSQQDRVAHKRLTGQMRPRPEAVQKPRGQVRPSPDRVEKPKGSVRPSPVAIEEPRGRGVLPSGTFLLSQVDHS